MDRKNLGQLLNDIGASYFVSYLYGKYIDKSHRNYKKRKVSKVSLIEKYNGVYLDLLELVVEMSEKRLDTNEIELTGNQVLDMAKKLVELFKYNSALTLHINTNNLISMNIFSQFISDFNNCLLAYEQEIGGFENRQNVNFICDVRKGSIKFDFIVKIVKEKIKDFLEYVKSYFSKENSNIDIRVGNETNISTKSTNKEMIKGNNIFIENIIINVNIDKDGKNFFE